MRGEMRENLKVIKQIELGSLKWVKCDLMYWRVDLS
jgi:hypothetical protein